MAFLSRRRFICLTIAQILRETPSFLTLHGSQKNKAELGLTRARLDRKIWRPKSAC
jgi:hypothetical protein